MKKQRKLNLCANLRGMFEDKIRVPINLNKLKIYGDKNRVYSGRQVHDMAFGHKHRIQTW